MPHVEIKCFSGRTVEQKQECAKQIATVISETLGCNISSVSVAIKDIDEADWKSMVWDKQIVPDTKYLYKKPGYSCEED
jgi:4-oxalocrotonate tautomerase